MAKKRFFKSKMENVLTYTGAVFYMNKYTEFNSFILNTPETIFSQHYSLFKNQTGVYRFNADGKTLYVGYSQDLKNRVRISYFNHCFGYSNVEFQYILADSKEEAMEIELHYIKTLQPISNISGKNKEYIKPEIEIPEFCNPIKLFFNEYWEDRKRSRGN